jgi:hypothetical protein
VGELLAQEKPYLLPLQSQRFEAFSEAAVLNVLRNEPLPDRGKLDLLDRPEWSNSQDGVRNAAIYDQLKERQEVLV